MSISINGTHDDLVWLAGILEGEGTFDLHRGRYPRIRVGMTDRDVVGRVATLMRSRIRMSISTVGYKASYHAEISGDRAAAIMWDLIPYMGARRTSKIADVLGARAGLLTDDTSSLPGPCLVRPPGLLSEREAPSVSSAA